MQNHRKTISAIKRCEALMQQSSRRDRWILYEHEVYEILKMMGLEIPVHRLIRAPEEVTPALLGQFSSSTIMLKAVRADLIHKSIHGGVRAVHKDLGFVQYSVARMQKEMQAHSTPPEGILLVEQIDYTRDLGNEVLLGFRESDAFGPVISFSKGGNDAEHFAAHFSAPNLILAPIDRRWAQALLASTRIQKKYHAQGQVDYTEAIVAAGVCFSDLAVAFSNCFPGDSAFVITEFEINPFVFTPDHRFVALDGYARFERRQPPSDTRKVASPDSMHSFFQPNGVAVVGVSQTDHGKTGNIIVENLLRMNRKDIFCVNVRGGTAALSDQRLPLYRNLQQIEAPVELVVVAAPAKATLTVVEDAATKGCRNLILIPGGFSEIDGDRDLEEKIRQIAQQSKMRLMGPNCLGLFFAGDRKGGLNTFFVPEDKFSIELGKKQNVALFSQSGALGITEVFNLRHAITPKVVVSYGNQLDVDPCDLVNYFLDDATIDVIACYIEGFKPFAGRKFFEIVTRSQKPIIVYKAGRTEAGRRATQSHTASIAGEYAVAKAALKQAGAVVANTMIDHAEFIKTFALLNDFQVNGNRVAGVANAGYEKAYAADNLGRLQLAELDAATCKQLETILPKMVVVDPLLDLTPMADDLMFHDCIEAMLRAESVDSLFVSIVPHSALIRTSDQEMHRHKENLASGIVRLAQKYKKPVVVSVNVISGADTHYNRLWETLENGGVPAFLTAKRAMACLNAFVGYRLMRRSQKWSEWLQ